MFDKKSVRQLPRPVRAILPVLFVIAASLTLQTPAIAQDDIFEEIQVTAKKREQSIYEVPASITAFSGATIESRGITDLIDIGKFVPNMNVTTFSAGHTSSANPFIRGIGLQDHLILTDPGVGVYVDGVYLGRQIGQNWSLANIDRVEVLRGPQGTLYGRNSIGGTINIITKAPGSVEGGRVAVKGGSRGRLNADFYADGMWGDSFGVSATGGFKRRNGVGDYLLIDSPKRKVGELQDVFGRVAARWTPTDNLSLTLAADANEGINGMNPYTTLIDEVPDGDLYQAGFRNTDVSADPYDSNSGQANQVEVKNQAHGIALTVDWAFSDNWATKLIASTRHSDYTAGLDDDSVFANFHAFPETGFADQDSFELQLNGEFGAFNLVSGIYYFSENGENDQPDYTFQAAPGSMFVKQEVTSKAIYGNLGFDISDRWNVSGGLRYTEDEKDAFTDLVFGLIMESNKRSWDEVSWELATTFDISDRLNIYGTIQSGYQSGQYPARPFCLFGNLDFTQPGNVSRPNCFQAPDNITALNYEAGIKGQPFDTLQMSLAVFYTDYKDLPYQVSTTVAGGFDTRNIIVDQTSTGLEWESNWAITDAFFLGATLGYIDIDVDDPVAVAPLTPELTFSLSPVYTLDLSSGASINFRADYSYRDSMFGEPTADPGRGTKIDSRALLNIDVAYTSSNGHWTAAAYAHNATDESYDNGRLNTGSYILEILNNDVSEFGLRYIYNFGN